MTSQRGLTLGKFAPFYKGHQFLIETALSEMDEVIVIIYEARETTSVPLNIRAGWIRRLYPDVQVIEAWDGPTEVGDTPEIKKKHEDYILNRLKLQGITHFYSSEFYGEHMSLALGGVPDRQKANADMASRYCKRTALYGAFLPDTLVLRYPRTGLLFGSKRVWLVAVECISSRYRQSRRFQVQFAAQFNHGFGCYNCRFFCYRGFYEPRPYTVSYPVS